MAFLGGSFKGLQKSVCCYFMRVQETYVPITTPTRGRDPRDLSASWKQCQALEGLGVLCWRISVPGRAPSPQHRLKSLYWTKWLSGYFSNLGDLSSIRISLVPKMNWVIFHIFQWQGRDTCTLNAFKNMPVKTSPCGILLENIYIFLRLYFW